MDSKAKEKEALERFGKRLSELRKERKLSFRKLAVLCEVDYSDIKKYEKGMKDLRLLTILDLSSGLNVHPKELLNFDVDFLTKDK
jgi:transcriptional regulator with XRE-family HTH domain